MDQKRDQSDLSASATDALRRTHLANERTYLAWWRTGFTAFAVSLGVAKIVPAITKGPRWSYTVLGAAFAVVGIFFIAYGLIRLRAVGSALDRGEFSNPDRSVVFGISLVGTLLGLGMLVLIVGSS